MGRGFISFLIIMFVFFQLSQTSIAIDTGTTGGKKEKIEKSQDLMKKKSIERGETFEIRLSADAVLLPVLAKLEDKTEVLKRCRVIGRPRLPRDFGIHAFIDENTIDSVKMQYLENQARINAEAPDSIKQYKECLAFYGAILAQAQVNLNEMMPESVDMEDLKTLAEIAVEKAIRLGPQGNLKSIYIAIVNDKSQCRFNNSLHLFRCGNCMVDLHEQTLRFGNLEVYGKTFMGYAGEYKVSSSDKATKEAILGLKKNFEKEKSASHTVSLRSFIPLPGGN